MPIFSCVRSSTIDRGKVYMTTQQVALQLYTVRDETGRDFAGTLRQVAEMGYAGVEFAGYGDLSAQAMRSLLAETGLQAVGSHVGMDVSPGLKDRHSRQIQRPRNPSPPPGAASRRNPGPFHHVPYKVEVRPVV